MKQAPAESQAPGHETDARSDRETRPIDAYRHISRHAAEHSRLGPFARACLDTIRERFNAPIAILEGRLSSSEIQLSSTPEDEPDTPWRANLESVALNVQVEDQAAARIYEHPPTGRLVALIAATLALDVSGSTSVIATIVHCETRQQAGAALQELQGLAALISSHARAIGSGENGDRFQDAAHRQSLTRAAHYKTLHEFAFAITNNLRSRIACEMVALSAIRNSRAQLLSISGLDEVKPRSPGVVSMRQAMEECFDSGRTIVFQRDDDWNDSRRTRQHRLHKRWSECAGNASVASIPMMDGDHVVGVVSLRRRSDRPFNEEDIVAIEEMLRPYGAALGLVSRATRTLTAHTRDSINAGALWLVKPGGWGPKVLLLLAALFIAWLTLGTIPHRVTTPCVVAAGSVRHLAAPFEARIGEVLVSEGDFVRAGDVLCRLDTRDLELERARLNSELGAIAIEINQAVALSDVAAAQLAQARRNVILSQLHLAERRIADATLTAPRDGLVIRGDLSRRIDEIVPQGEPLFELAPIDEIELELLAPETAITHIQDGLPGAFASDARPDHPIDLTIARIAPASEIRDGRNVFVIHADLDINSNEEWLRIGMQGVAKVDAGDRAVWWVLAHRVVDQVRMRLWL